MINSLIQDLNQSYQKKGKLYLIDYSSERAKFLNAIHLAYKYLPEHGIFFNRIIEGCANVGYSVWHEAVPDLEYILELASFEEKSTSTSSKKSVFDSVDDKIAQATLSFKKEDYPAVLNHLNTALELMLKDKLEIPTTITKINTSKIIDIMIAEKIGPYLHLAETKKHLY